MFTEALLLLKFTSSWTARSGCAPEGYAFFHDGTIRNYDEGREIGINDDKSV